MKLITILSDTVYLTRYLKNKRLYAAVKRTALHSLFNRTYIITNVIVNVFYKRLK